MPLVDAQLKPSGEPESPRGGQQTPSEDDADAAAAVFASGEDRSLWEPGGRRLGNGSHASQRC